MKPIEAWEYASSWGSYIRSGDPGACMYSFDEHCMPQSEEHRQAVIRHMNLCRMMVTESPDRYEDDELSRIDSFVEFIRARPLHPMHSQGDR